MGDLRTTTGQPLPLTPREQTRRTRRWVIAAALAVGAVVAAALFIRVDCIVPATGYVTTEEYAEVRPAIQAAVASILVSSGDRVAAGDVLLRLEDAEEMASCDEARSRLAKIEAQRSRRVAEVAQEARQRTNEVAVARLRLEHATSSLELTRELSARGLAAGRALDDAKLREQLARAELNMLAAYDETLPLKELEVLQRESEAAGDALVRAEARLRQRQVCAPIAGRVQRYSFVVGELVKPDMVLYEIFGGNRQILKLRLAERYATLVHPGQPYEAELLAFRGRRKVWFDGKVEMLRDVIETENQSTYRVAYGSFFAGPHEVPPGTTAEARINVGRVPLWVRLLGFY